MLKYSVWPNWLREKKKKKSCSVALRRVEFTHSIATMATFKARGGNFKNGRTSVGYTRGLERARKGLSDERRARDGWWRCTMQWRMQRERTALFGCNIVLKRSIHLLELERNYFRCRANVIREILRRNATRFSRSFLCILKLFIYFFVVEVWKLLLHSLCWRIIHFSTLITNDNYLPCMS